MKTSLFLIGVFLATSAIASPAAPPAKDPFPAALELPELQRVLLESSIEDPAGLAHVSNGKLFSAVGFEGYAQRVYALAPSGDLNIRVVTLMDFRAAYSLLTLLRGAGIQSGPPGDAQAVSPGSISFCQGRKWISIFGRNASQDLIQRAAMSVSGKIGPPGQQKPPPLTTRFPKLGFDASGMRYFPSIKAFEAYSGSGSLKFFGLDVDAEVAQAPYNLDGRSGVMFLLDFPTDEVAEDYFASVSELRLPEGTENRTYAKRAGPIVAVLAGRFDPGSADRILSSLSYSYSIRWVYEKKNKSKIIWGVPISILETVVKSIFFVVLLCLVAIVAGTGSAILRFVFGSRSSKKGKSGGFKPGDMTRLRLR